MSAKRRLTNEVRQFGAEHFRWRVHPDGYLCEHRHFVELSRRDVVRAGLVLVPRNDFRANEWQPLQEPGFFRQLAACRTTADGIQAFANRCGLLGIYVQVPEKGSKELTPLDSVGELVGQWAGHIAELRGVLGIWDALASGRLEDLSHWVLNEYEVSDLMDGRPRTTRSVLSSRWHFAAQDDQERWTGAYPIWDTSGIPEEGIDREAAARFLMAQMTNRNLEDHCTPYLRPRPFRTDSYTLHMTPKNLLGAAWWQFARLLAGESTHRPCKVCGTLIELSTTGEGFRADKEFCSNTCKQRDHRRRIREAKAMKAAGKTVSQIAKHFGADVDTIKRWLASRK